MSDQEYGKRRRFLGGRVAAIKKSSDWAAWLGGAIALLCLSVWLAQLNVIWLGPVLVGSALWATGAFHWRSSLAVGVAAFLFGAAGVAAGIQFRLRQIETSWDVTKYHVEERSAAALGEALDNLVAAGEEAAAGAADAARILTAFGDEEEAFRRLEQLQAATGVSAVALYGTAGQTLAWAGEHRGIVPAAATSGEMQYLFEQGPIFSYLYFSSQLESGVVATAAFLLDASLEVEDEEPPFADDFEARFGIRPLFLNPQNAEGEALWDWATNDGAVYLSVAWAELTQQAWWDRVARDGRIAAGLLTLAGLIFLSSAWYHRKMRGSALPVLMGTLVLLLAPLGEMFSGSELFSPLLFVLPFPRDITLGALLVLLVGLATAILSRAGEGKGRRLPLLITLVVLPFVFPLAILLIERSASEGLLASRAAGGYALQLCATLVSALPLFLILKAARPVTSNSRWTRSILWAAFALAGLFATVILLLWDPGESLPLELAALWAIPAALVAALPMRDGRIPTSLRTWLIAGWLGGTAALAFMWPMHVRAELQSAERELGLLGSEADPFLDFLLRQTAEEAARLNGEGASGINLLYQSWVGSGLAEERYDASLALWSGSEMAAQLNLSGTPPLSDSIVGSIAATSPETLVRHYGGEQGLQYLLLARLPNSQVLSITLPPRRYVGGGASLARFLDPEDEGDAAARGETLYLVPIDAAMADALSDRESSGVRWNRTTGGWRSGSIVRMPEGLVDAHLVVETPVLPLIFARAILLLIALLVALLLIWLLAKAACRELGDLSLLRTRWLRSFRGRLSLALSIFFLFPTLVFGFISYGAVAQEVVRSAAALAQQSLNQAAGQATGSFNQAIHPGGEDLLLYVRGTLVGATSPELVGLGLFQTWLPPEVFLRFARGADVQELDERRLAESEYLVAYRRLDSQRVLAAPIPLASHEITRRQTEFRDVALLVVLIGLAISLVLALFVSRALARPLDELSRAAMTVGAGNFRTALPESRPDEFGSVYLSFNRMVRRLRETRAALVQETRRTETIVAEAATGVLALDAEGRVELINPRAGEILGKTLAAGEPLLGAGGEDGSFENAIERLWYTPSPEAAAELEADGRIIRLKLRHLPADESGGQGAVVALEDVTAEVRTARVLAWGEMARQVAHEIKNPLTPIKLAVQHIRRAYTDKRPDFEEILERNVASILREIDRLGEIARAFSRFGTPAAVTTPLESVDVVGVVDEMLSLYRGSSEGAVITAEVPDGERPRAIARTDELKEVLLNLLENAREAAEGDSGAIVVSVQRLEEGEGLLLSVRDSGVGIPEELLPRIFEPHFSTRSSGTGLGLAIVRRIVDSWGGRIQAESTRGEGTRFDITLRTGTLAPTPVHGLQPLPELSVDSNREDQDDRPEEG